MASTAKTLMTAEEVFQLPEKPGVWRFELINGKLVEAPGAGGLHTLVAGLIYRLLHAYVTEHRLGVVFSDGVGYILARNPGTVRVPDGSFISADRVPPSGAPLGFIDIVPDLVVEVISPGNSAAEMRRKIRDYLSAGARMVWVAWPEERTISVYAGSVTPTELTGEDTLDGGDVLPGFSVRVAELFDIEW